MEKTIQTVATCMLKENEIMAAKLSGEDFKSQSYNIPDQLRKVIESMRVRSNTEVISELVWNIVCALCVAWTIISLAYLISIS